MGQTAGYFRIAEVPAQAKLYTDATVRKGIAATSHESERLRAAAHSLCVSAHCAVCCRGPRPLTAQLRVSVLTRLKQHFHFSSLLRKAFFIYC